VGTFKGSSVFQSIMSFGKSDAFFEG